ncbi:peptidase M42 family protein [Thermoclostridium stercorarium subsp. stercorarium DSM 8532]|uniref:Peptidase M42 family protein n=2 Tax=Thermoclostridium stercorarium TaxID=1510 RepID=L7VLN9_THES1|nr:M42 family metallopeptidase [Thermoclostridium stercorarium]AGC67612.1 peptidase M42 family protein [Thermoclostridium stercorarium subsp. stercorarium DSM 8532]AGI38662.1 cellulase [Thermoclostridium stercorarium subsp. stercorarium DSM 8532]ANW98034.1 aminopeptidase [Thermoclostridium stercorarium subsp. thermolacticum DSM 2910]
MRQKLAELTWLDGISGNEQNVRNFIIQNLPDKSLKYYVDNIGNLIVKGRSNGNCNLRVMVAAHMDEVGFMVNYITDDGKLKFSPVGGVDSRILIGQHVRVGKDKIPGVIGYKSIHLQDKSERESVVKIKSLYIDIAAKDRENAQELVSTGDYVAFASEPVFFGDGKIKAKALDDRAGCAVIMELLKETWPFELYACFTVQEEIGLRGALVAANRVKPDIGIVLEGTTCADVPKVKEHETSTVMGKGPSISFADRTSLADRELFNHFINTAEKEGIRYQIKNTVSGGNDAGRIQTSGTGVRTLVVSVPCRYIHSPVSVLDLNDLDNMLKLVSRSLHTLPEALGR